MKNSNARLTVAMLACIALCDAQAGLAEDLKVFISVDMEGITGVYEEDEVSHGKPEYEYFRGVLTRETNAAIEGAFAAGATEVLVREGHGGMNHLKLDLVDPRVRVVRGATHPQSMMVMMEGFDDSFDAVVFIGYHARAGYPNAVLAHTMGMNIEHFRINGVVQSEGSNNALIAGMSNVPVVMLAGDKAACDDVRETLGEGIETVAVKEALNGGIITVHPDVSVARIRAAVERGVRNRGNIRPYRLQAPYVVTIRKSDAPGKLIPGAFVNALGEIEYKTSDMRQALNALVQMW